MKRIIRDRRLTPEEAAKYKAIRAQVADELPDLIARHHEGLASLDRLHELFMQLKSAREAKGLSLADLSSRAAKPGRPAATKVAAKYRDKASGSTWSGRGLRPNWLKAAIAAGKKLEDFAV